MYAPQRLGVKLSHISDRYHKQIEQSLAESRESFTGVQTPGWSSLIKSQLSDRIKSTHSAQKQESDILTRLKKLPPAKWQQKGPMYSLSDKNETLDTNKAQQRRDSRGPNEAVLRGPNEAVLRGQNEAVLRGQNKALLRNESTGQLKKREKRWKQITVHEHLYQQSRKLQNKRMIKKVLDEEHKKEVFKFHPQINPNSARLAESKFSRLRQAPKSIDKEKEDCQQEMATSQVKEKQSKEVERYRVLNRTFYYLSCGSPLLEQSCANSTVAGLPLPCIECLQPILSELYQGRGLEWVQFLEMFNSGKRGSKEGFFRLMAKWFSRLDQSSNQ